jgi:hypothetical protein
VSGLLTIAAVLGLLGPPGGVRGLDLDFLHGCDGRFRGGGGAAVGGGVGDGGDPSSTDSLVSDVVPTFSSTGAGVGIAKMPLKRRGGGYCGGLDLDFPHGCDGRFRGGGGAAVGGGVGDGGDPSSADSLVSDVVPTFSSTGAGVGIAKMPLKR